ncbi:MAG TPA: ATP synthase F0 subunit C [Gemmataceae bacterium]|nr:ATP synthase F0 subunit C [Gemmataceae bacterium]
MNVLRIVGLVLVVFLIYVSPAFAQEPGTHYTLSGGAIGAGVGAALTIVGAGYGFGRIGAAALESMARQPEVAGRIGTSMIIIAALLEGATFFSLIVCILINGNAKF